jgi:hypothetical protein
MKLYAPGSRVQARFGGGKKYYSGLVQRQNADGHYEIDYDDGDFECVHEKLMRPCGSVSTPHNALLWLRANLSSSWLVKTTLSVYFAAQLGMLYTVRDLGHALLQLQLTFTSSAYKTIVRSWSSTQLTQYEDHFKVSCAFCA